MAALLHGKLDYDDLFVSQAGSSSSLFPDDHRSNSAPPTQLLNSRRGHQEPMNDPEQSRYYQDAQQQQQPWQLWQNGEDGKFVFPSHY